MSLPYCISHQFVLSRFGEVSFTLPRIVELVTKGFSTEWEKEQVLGLGWGP